MRLATAYGRAVSVLSLPLFFAGHLRLDVHGFGLFALAQSIRVVLVALFPFRREVG